MRKPRLTLQDFNFTWHVPSRRGIPVDLSDSVKRIIVEDGPDPAPLSIMVYSRRYKLPAIIRAFHRFVIVLAAEEELPPLSPMLWLKAKRFPIVDQFPIACIDEWKEMVFIKAELPA